MLLRTIALAGLWMAWLTWTWNGGNAALVAQKNHRQRQLGVARGIFGNEGFWKEFRRKWKVSEGDYEEGEEEEDDEKDGCGGIYSCVDCNTARICRPLGDGRYEEVKRVQCPPIAPNCDYETGTCMFRIDPFCSPPDDFICLGNGRFPDVDCRFYHECVNLSSTKRQCDGPAQTYNAERGSCDEVTPCGSFDCSSEWAGRKTAMTIFPRYFAYCDETGAVEPLVVDKCPGTTRFNGTSQMCEPSCSEEEGLVADPNDRSSYYRCRKLWLSHSEWRMIKERKKCPPNTIFREDEFTCVPVSPDYLIDSFKYQVQSQQQADYDK